MDDVRKQLDLQRKEQESKLKKEQKGIHFVTLQLLMIEGTWLIGYFLKQKINFFVLAFDSNEKKRMQEELDAYNAALEDEMEREKQKHQRNLEALNHRKEDMIKEKKQKLKVSIYYILLIFLSLCLCITTFAVTFRNVCFRRNCNRWLQQDLRRRNRIK